MRKIFSSGNVSTTNDELIIFLKYFSFFLFVVTETYGYSPVVRIPRGATHVRLTDNSSNYLGNI
jgi:hypothetical protein